MAEDGGGDAGVDEAGRLRGSGGCGLRGRGGAVFKGPGGRGAAYARGRGSRDRPGLRRESDARMLVATGGGGAMLGRLAFGPVGPKLFFKNNSTEEKKYPK